MGQGKSRQNDFRRDKRGGGYGNERDSDYGRYEPASTPPERDYGRSSSAPRSRPESGGGGGDPVVATVKFYNADKGFGFVSVLSLGEDAFIHVSKLGDHGEHLPEGATLECHVKIDDRKGKLAVTSVESVDVTTAGATSAASPRPAGRGPRPATQAGPSSSAQGTLRFFNTDKGFGFVDIGNDVSVFVHISVFERGAVSIPKEGDRYEVEYVNEDRGPKARGIRRI